MLTPNLPHAEHPVGDVSGGHHGDATVTKQLRPCGCKLRQLLLSFGRDGHFRDGAAVHDFTPRRNSDERYRTFLPDLSCPY